MTERLKQLEAAVQSAIDRIRRSDPKLAMQTAMMISSLTLNAPCPQLSDWLVAAITDGGHCNESLIDLQRWDTRTVVHAFGVAILLAASFATHAPAASELGEALLKLFQETVAHRMPHLKSNRNTP